MLTHSTNQILPIMFMNEKQMMSRSRRLDQSSSKTNEPRPDMFTQYPMSIENLQTNIIQNEVAAGGATSVHQNLYFAMQSCISKKKEHLQFNNQGFAQLSANHATQMININCLYCRGVCFFEPEGFRCQCCRKLHRFNPPSADLWRYDPHQTEVKEVVSESATTIANKGLQGNEEAHPVIHDDVLFNGVPLHYPTDSIMRNDSESSDFQAPLQDPDIPNQDGTDEFQYKRSSGTKQNIDRSDTHPCDRFNSPTRTSSCVPHNKGSGFIPAKTNPGVPCSTDLVDRSDVPTRTNSGVSHSRDLVDRSDVPTRTNSGVSRNRDLASLNSISAGQCTHRPPNNIKMSPSTSSHDSSSPPNRNIVLNNESILRSNPLRNFTSYHSNSTGPNNVTRNDMPQIPNDIRFPFGGQNVCFTANDLNGHGVDNSSLGESSIADYGVFAYDSTNSSQSGRRSLEDNIAVVPDQTSLLRHSTENVREIGTNTDPINNTQEHLEIDSHENAQNFDGGDLVYDLKLEVVEMLQEMLDPDMGKNWAHIASRHGWKNAKIKQTKFNRRINSPFEYFLEQTNGYSMRDLFNDLESLPRMDVIKALKRQGLSRAL